MKFMKNSNKITSSLSLPSLVISPHCFFFFTVFVRWFTLYMYVMCTIVNTQKGQSIFWAAVKVFGVNTLYPSICSVKFLWKLKPSFFSEIYCYFCEIGDCFQLLFINFAQTLAPSKFLLGNHAKRKRS